MYIINKKNYSLKKEFTGCRHADCFDEIDTYFSERARKKIREGYLFQVRNLCRRCIIVYFEAIKGDLITLFNLNVCE